MYIIFAMDALSGFLLLWGFGAVWKERNRFFSLRPILPAVAFLLIGRFCDMVLEHSSRDLTHLFGLEADSFGLVFSTLGNVADVIGVTFLLLGFLKIIAHQQEEEKHIHDLETLLPLCANCKKYRTKDNQWMPIEKYLMESGAPMLTHGICPECSTKLYGDVLRSRS